MVVGYLNWQPFFFWAIFFKTVFGKLNENNNFCDKLTSIGKIFIFADSI